MEARGGRTPPMVRMMRWVLFGLLIVSAALSLVGLPELQEAVAAGRTPPVALALPPAFLALFIAGYAVYRIALVRAGRYPAGKALVQIAVMLLVLGVVAGIALRPPTGLPAPRGGPVELTRPLASADPEVRALAAEVARHRPREEALAAGGRLVELLGDAAPEVRRQARATLVALAGRDVGGEAVDATQRWRDWLRGAGR